MSAKTDVRRCSVTLLSLHPLLQGTPPFRNTILYFPFVVDVLEKALHVVCNILGETEFWMGLGLPCFISTYSDNLSSLIPSGLTLLPFPVFFLFMLE